MKTFAKLTLAISVIFLLEGCQNGPQPIDYGNDGCHFCKMTIVDKIHGSELVTDKGKVYKFDATECMINYIAQNPDMNNATLLTNYYESPTELIHVEQATFLISTNLPSPMGANLTAFETKETANKIKAEKGGDIYNWQTLQEQIKN